MELPAVVTLVLTVTSILISISSAFTPANLANIASLNTDLLTAPASTVSISTLFLGASVGKGVGEAVGEAVGEEVGEEVGAVGEEVGAAVGAAVGEGMNPPASVVV